VRGLRYSQGCPPCVASWIFVHSTVKRRGLPSFNDKN
jgi:hypothetical protein